jgi:hypothetical protein
MTDYKSMAAEDGGEDNDYAPSLATLLAARRPDFHQGGRIEAYRILISCCALHQPGDPLTIDKLIRYLQEN